MTALAHELTTWQRLRIIVVLGSLTALGPLTIDTYLPAFPAIAEQLDAAESAVQLTLTGTLIGVALGQLLVGPVSDALGRKRPLVAAVATHVAVSVLCALAPNIVTLGALRVIQGMAAAAGAVIAMAVVRDLFPGVTGVRMLSRLMLVTGVAPILAPSLGAQLLRITDWRGIFWVLALIGAALIAVVAIGLRETLPPQKRQSGGVAATVKTYGVLAQERTFMGLMLTGGLMMAALFAYISGSSFVMQDVYGLSEQDFGLMFGVNSVGLVLATQVNAKVAVRYGPQRVLGVAVAVAAVASVSLLITTSTGAFGLAGVVVPLFVMLSTVGFTLPNVPILALANHGRTAGTAAGLIGASNFAFGAVSAPTVGALGTASAMPMAAVMSTATLGAVTALYVVVRPFQLELPGFATKRSLSQPVPTPVTGAREIAVQREGGQPLEADEQSNSISGGGLGQSPRHLARRGRDHIRQFRRRTPVGTRPGRLRGSGLRTADRPTHLHGHASAKSSQFDRAEPGVTAAANDEVASGNDWNQ